MISPLTKLITAGIGTIFVMIFVFGLAESISAGFAGFWGGLPFWIIAIAVMLLTLYDFYDETIRKK
ncbi:MAG: hypothetical protein VW736_10820 [Alphaproteobacteria bacterium]|jgi:hypothetical protein